MGKKKEPLKRVVLDTNILVSALLFRGELNRILILWKTGKVTPVISGDTFKEFSDVLRYPKFKLTTMEIKRIIEEEVLPYFEIVDDVKELHGVCSDPDDDKFLACAVASGAKVLVSGDAELCNVRKYKSVRIISARDFLESFT